MLGPWTFGTEPCQGRRTDLVRMTTALQSCTVEDILLDPTHAAHSTAMKHLKAARLVRSLILRKRSATMMETRVRSGESPMTPPRCWWLVGPTGIRKTSTILKKHGLTNLYSPLVTSHSDGLWWDNYAGQPVLLLDEFNPGTVSLQVLLQLLDGNPLLQLPVKGGSVYPSFTHVYVVQNELQQYPHMATSQQCALARRVEPIFVADPESVEAAIAEVGPVPSP